jgi:hypothetical protein
MLAIAGGVFSNGLFFTAQPYQLNYGEGLAAWQAARVTDLARSYAPIDRYPFVVFQYPPVFHLVTHAAGAMTGDLLRAGRLVSVLSAALLCLVIGWTTFQALPRRLELHMRLFAATFAATLPTALYNFSWTWTARVDTLAILLSFSGAALFAARSRSTPAQILAALLMTAGIFTRQTAFAAPLACLLVAWLMDRKIALRIVLTMGILGGLALAWLGSQTHGQVFLHLFRYNQTAFSVTRAALGVMMNVRHIAGLVVLAGAASAGVLDRVRHHNRALTNGYRRSILLFALYGVFAALSSLAFGKEGSDVNYFLEWNVSLAPLVGIFLLRLLPSGGRKITRLRPVSIAGAVVPLLLFSSGLDQARDGWLRIFKGPLPADREQIALYRRMAMMIGETPGMVFSEDMNLLYKTGKEIPAEPAMIQCLAKAGLWDERPFVGMIQQRRFALIVTMLNRESDQIFSRQRYSPAVASAIDQAYEQATMLGDYMIYRPRRP